MTGALVILGALVVIGTILYITDVKYFRHHHTPQSSNLNLNGSRSGDLSHEPNPQNSNYSNPTEEDICCGQHLVCEKTSLSIVSDEIIYYDDEELDRFIGRSPESYSSEEIEEFRDVLMTLLPQDVAGWAKSITLRKIHLPMDVKDELFLIISELRTS